MVLPTVAVSSKVAGAGGASALATSRAAAVALAAALIGAAPAPLAAAEGRSTASAQTAEAEAAAPPTYRTRIPPSARVAYRLSRGAIVGSGALDWRVEGDSYLLRLEGSVPIVGTLLVQTSRGGFDAAGLAPLRFTDARLRRAERSASFDRAAGRVGFSGDERALPLLPGMQDRLSVMLQLAAIAHAWARPPAVGTVLTLPVVGARGNAKLWALRYEGPQTLRLSEGEVKALRFLRAPQDGRDTRAEFWLDPAASYMPVRARLSEGDDDALELLRVPQVP